jgi:hypothetical protein
MPFDFNAFIAGTQLAKAPVYAYARDHTAEIAALKAQYEALPDDGDARESTQGSDRDRLAQAILTLQEDMTQSRQEWVLRTLGPDEFKALSQDDDLDVYDQMAMQSNPPDPCPNPKAYADLPGLTADQWRQIAAAVGAVQWGVIVGAANDLILSKVAVPDFSPNTSMTPSPSGS